MKIEMGESLLQSYLKHVKKCRISQTNWKTSSNWDITQDSYDRLEYIFEKIKKNNEFSDVFKKSEMSQILKQAEIDVLGLDNMGTVYMIEVAFHENGLNYGSKIETKNKIFEKLLRALLIGSAYFPGSKLEILFASPKTNPATEQIITEYFEILTREFGTDTVNFGFITNSSFEKEILLPTIKAADSDSDTSELFLRTYKMLDMFGFNKETPQNVNQNNAKTSNVSFSPQQIIKVPLSQPSNVTQVSGQPPRITFFVNGVEVSKSSFKTTLLQTKFAKRTWIYSSGRQVQEPWNASNFTVDSDLMANIKTSSKYRNWRDTGIVQVIYEI